MSAAKRTRACRPLSDPDLLILRAAEGWLDLGNPDEANLELEKISPKRSTHPDVLALQWHICAKLENWDACLFVARALTQRAPDDHRGWIALAQTFYFTRHLSDAYEIGVTKAEEFPESWHLLYDTACYACLLGKHEEAVQFLDRAMTVGDAHAIRLQAMKDPDLKDLWEHL